MKRAWIVAMLLAGGSNACEHELTRPPPPPPPPPPPTVVVAFFGDFTLVQADDWAAGQRCNHILELDQTVCSWGRLSITTDPAAVSVRGFDVHAGLLSGPVIYQDSVSFTIPLRVLDACTVAIDSIEVTPNGRGTLSGNTLRFDGRNAASSLSWVYSVVWVQRGTPCG